MNHISSSCLMSSQHITGDKAKKESHNLQLPCLSERRVPGHLTRDNGKERRTPRDVAVRDQAREVGHV